MIIDLANKVDKMKKKTGLKPFLVAISVFIWLAVIIITTMYLIGHLILDLPIWLISIATGLSLLAAAGGAFGSLIAKEKYPKKE